MYWQQHAHLDREVQDASLLVHHKVAAGLPNTGMPAQSQRKLKAVPRLHKQPRN